MRTTFFFVFSFIFSILLHAQQKQVYVDIIYDSYDNEKIPFQLVSVEFTPNKIDTIGWFENKGSKDAYPVLFVPGIEASIQTYLDKRFTSGRKEPKILLQIRRVEIVKAPNNSESTKDSFHFECAFIRKGKQNETLYVFRGRNNITLQQEPEKIIASYVARAMVSGVQQFSKALVRNPDWNDEPNTSPFKVKLKVVHNEIKSNDSLACEKNRKLRFQDFKGVLQNEPLTTNAISKVGITYKAESEENSKGIDLKVNTIAFFDKNRSWIKENLNDEQTLMYQQGHFNLCAYYGYRLRDTMAQYEFSAGEFKGELNKIYNTVNMEYVNKRKEYIEATVKGTNSKELEIWLTKIDVMLKSIN